MIKEMNFVRYTCDICKKVIDVDKNKDNPFKRLVLPIPYYDECGNFNRIMTESIDVCKECLEQMLKDISEHYEMASIAYEGLRITRKGGVEK